ncbi:malignant T cell-amplified sequence 1-like protein, partial [Cricetulus griseus]
LFDKGAIKFALSRSNITRPGFTSGAKLYLAAVDTIVTITAERKQHTNSCVGVMEMSEEDRRY